MFYDNDCDLALIRRRRVAVLGYGAQGRAHARNLRDSGVEVQVGLRTGSASRTDAAAHGLPVATPEEAVAHADLVALLIPDAAQSVVYRDIVAPRLRPQGAIVFAHGYNIHFGHIVPREDLDVVMVAPLGVGDQVRAVFERGGGVPAMLAVQQDASGTARQLALAYAGANGHGRAGIIETTFREETETDLFAEQAVLCGGLTHLIQAGYDTLVEAGYDPQVAYFCCLHEVKLLADLIHERGLAGMRESISLTAEYGDYTRGPRVINAQSRAAMRELLEEIRSGSFARELAREIETGLPQTKQQRQASKQHSIEQVGAGLRARMSWLSRKS